MSLVGDKGGEENHCHVPSGGHSVTHVPSGRQGGEECLCHVPSVGRSVAYVPSGGVREERRITAMYPVGDTQ